MAMNPEIKTRWSAKLREEGRQQTQHMLRNRDGAQCCLDVLCEVAIEDKVIAPPKWDAENNKYGYVDYESDGVEFVQYDVLPRVVRDWAGLASSDPTIYGRDEGQRASGWNDVKHYSFDQIADLIDADETL